MTVYTIISSSKGSKAQITNELNPEDVACTELVPRSLVGEATSRYVVESPIEPGRDRRAMA